MNNRLKARLEVMPVAQLIDWICLSCVDIRATHSDDDAQDMINDIRALLESRMEAPQPEPVGAVLPDDIYFLKNGGKAEVSSHYVGMEGSLKLYTAPPAPVVTKGWKLVPVDPTEGMVIAGFESEPDESFSTAEAWGEYQAMSGCRQAAYKAKLCWNAMIAAAPTP